MDSAPAPTAIEPFSLLETMRLEGGRLERLERHVARMEDAARYFGYPWNESRVRDALAAAVAAHPAGCWRVRLLLSADGRTATECTPHPEGPNGRWRVAFAQAPVDEHDPFVRHKTTRRLVYDAARRAAPGVDDVILWNSRGEVTESTIGNVVAEIDGLRYTPPVECGLLPGTFRAEQIDAGTVRERVLTKDHVERASRLWLINSVREWVEVELVSLAGSR